MTIKSQCKICRQDTYYTIDDEYKGCVNYDCKEVDANLCIELKDCIKIEVRKRLDFCGCGDNDEAFIFIKKLLDLKTKKYSECGQNTKKEVSFEDSKKFIQNYFEELEQIKKENIEAMFWIVEYLLDAKGITSHGGAVSSSWVVDFNFKELLDLHCENILKD